MTSQKLQQHMSGDKNTHEHTPSLSTSILQRIEQEHVTPTPRWKFIFSEYAIWTLWGVSILCGAIAVSVMVFISIHAEYALYEATHDTFVSFFLEVLPYVWVIVFVLMAVIAYLNIRHTKRGYRYPLWQILASSIVFSVLGGFVLHIAGVGFLIDSETGHAVPMYSSLQRAELRMWQQPQEGRMVGHIVEPLGDSDTVSFADVNGGIWTLNVHELFMPDLDALQDGKQVRVLGILSSSTNGYFYGCGVFPWIFNSNTSLTDLQRQRSSFLDRMKKQEQQAQQEMENVEDRMLEDGDAPDEMLGICGHHKTVLRIQGEFVPSK